MSYTVANQGAVRERFEKPEAYVGYWVLDPEGRKLGIVSELYANTHNEPEYIRMSLGLFGLRSVLIPVQSVAVNEERRTLVLQ